MNASEPTLFSHLNEARAGYFPEGGLSNVMLCGMFSDNADVTAVMQAHRKVVEEEVNNESTNVTGILIVQVDFNHNYHNLFPVWFAMRYPCGCNSSIFIIRVTSSS